MASGGDAWCLAVDMPRRKKRGDVNGSVMALLKSEMQAPCLYRVTLRRRP